VVAERRFGPLIVVLFLVLGVLVVRLFQVQVVEHEVWAGEAASLVRSSELKPSCRGAIVDREGRPFVDDEKIWRVDFVYRDFRRENPLGIVAHARSTLEMRCVPLAEALANIVPWGLDVAKLSMADLDALEKTGAFAAAKRPPVSGADAGLCRARASDLRYYVYTLLSVGANERRRMRAAHVDPKSPRPYVEVLAEFRKTTAQSLLDALAADLGRQRDLLAGLASILPAPEKGRAETPASLLERMEAARARFEDAAADALFEEATGFAPGRISTASLARSFDLSWLAGSLRWDAARLAAWEASRRADFTADLAGTVAPRILVRAGLDEHGTTTGESVLDGLAAVYAQNQAPDGWRDLEELAVLDDARGIFDLEREPDWKALRRRASPLLDADLRKIESGPDDPWIALATLAETAGARLEVPRPTAGAREWAARWEAIAEKDRHLEGEEANAALVAILSALEARFLAASDAGFDACLAAAASGGDGTAPLRLSRAARDRVEQRERFLLKDLSSRPVSIAPDASYPLVHLLERHADAYHGFEVRATTRRKIQARAADGVPVARTLIGGVRGPSLRDLMKREKRRQDGDDEEGEVLDAIARTDDRQGSYGIEALFDAELRGRNGWFETAGLDEASSSASVKAAVDGCAVVLTLDRDLQLAAQQTLAHPEAPPDGSGDATWLAHPVGAIVLITPDGEVLAAASEPTEDGLEPTPGRDLERSHARERTLTRPTFNPPGSVFKPFVAAYALDHIGLDPNEQFGCGPLDDKGWGYGDRFGTMHCHRGGHGSSDLAKALAGSCNAAFAQIGERFTPEQLLEMADVFGFGRPTGIRDVTLANGVHHRGLREDAEWRWAPRLPKELKDPGNRMRFANGLGLVEATPMQVARATAGLVTGKLPAIRIARRVAGEEVVATATDLPISARAREIVCRDLRGVIDDPGGTAHVASLERASLGFEFVCKTGSADTWDIVRADGSTNERTEGQKKMRKQTWIAGWFPGDAPKAILVVMLHDTMETSTHTSVFVAAQFLHSPAVKRFVEGAPVAAVKEESR